MKTLLLSIATLLFTTAAFSQNCLDIVPPTTFSGPDIDGNFTLTIFYTTNGTKSLRTTVYCRDIEIFTDCFTVNGTGTKEYKLLACFNDITQLSATFITRTGNCLNSAQCAMTRLDRIAVLPVKLTTFSAVRSQQSVNLNWSTDEEIKLKEFIVERAEGNVFRSVGTVQAVGNSSTRQTYSFNDINDNTGVTYYRLKNVDVDGRVTYSEVRTIRASGSASDVTVFPNPAPANSKISIVGASANSSIQLIDISGKVLKNLSNNTMNSLDLSGVKSGTYLIRILDKATNEVVNKKITITN